MRVITGKAKGIRLETLDGDDVRPTTDKIKESIFNILQFQVEGKNFLDLFGGSGQIGIEALSRGAKKVVFVDNSNKSINVIKENLKKVKLEENANVIKMDSVAFLDQCNEKFDIVFLDPPYKKGILQNALSKIEKVMNIRGTIVCENPIDEDINENIGSFTLQREFKYGKIRISIYNKD